MITAVRAATLLSFSLVCTSIACTSIACAQATPAATQLITLSAFAGATGSYTGLEKSRNASFTAGFDVGVKPFHSYYPSAEIRGTYPVDNGTIAGEKNFLAGLKVERFYGEFHPYADILYGRNKIEYQSGGYPNPGGTLLYLESVAGVLSFGGGVDIDLTPHFALKLDGQYQRYGTPVTASGEIYTKAFLAGIIYRIDFNHHFHYDRKTGRVTNLPKERTPPPPRTPLPPPPSPDTSASPDATVPPPPAPDPTTTPSASTPDPAPTAPAPTPQPQ